MRIVWSYCRPLPSHFNAPGGKIQRRPSLWLEEEHHGECDDEAQFYDSHGGDGTDRRSVDSAQDPLGHCYSTFDRLQESAQEW